MAAKYSDWYFINGNSIEGVKEQIDEVRALAAAEGRTVKFGLNGFVIQRSTEAEALEQLEAIVAGDDPDTAGYADDIAVLPFHASDYVSRGLRTAHGLAGGAA